MSCPQVLFVFRQVDHLTRGGRMDMIRAETSRSYYELDRRCTRHPCNSYRGHGSNIRNSVD
jgi:hypothetical protein